MAGIFAQENEPKDSMYLDPEANEYADMERSMNVLAEKVLQKIDFDLGD